MVNKYIESKKLSWSESTVKSEQSRLKHASDMTLGPVAHYLKLKDELKPYALKTTFIRLSDFMQWQIDEAIIQGPNTYKTFMKKNAKLFKGVYEKEKIEIGFKEAVQRIKGIADTEVREKAIQLLSTGMRWTESFTLDDLGMVTGKGNKRRRVFNKQAVEFIQSKSSFARKLFRATGLKPHGLRKLFANEMVKRGFSSADLMQVMGWSDISTATSYLQAKKDDELAEKLKLLVG
jgi:site-specific recombinase XerD